MLRYRNDGTTVRVFDQDGRPVAALPRRSDDRRPVPEQIRNTWLSTMFDVETIEPEETPCS